MFKIDLGGRRNVSDSPSAEPSFKPEDLLTNSDALHKRHKEEPRFVGVDGMPRPWLSLLARHLMWLKVREWAVNGIYPKSGKPKYYEVCPEHEFKGPIMAYEEKNGNIRDIKGWRAIAKAWVLHVYGSKNPEVIAAEPDVAFQPFSIRRDIVVEDVENDPRGVTKLVRATQNIERARIIGLYEGEWVLDIEKDADPNLSCLNRLESEYKLFESSLIDCEKAHIIPRDLAIKYNLPSYTKNEVDADFRIEEFLHEDERNKNGRAKVSTSEGLIRSSLLTDGAKCRGLYGWTSEINDFRDLSKPLCEQVENGNNCEITEILIAGWRLQKVDDVITSALKKLEVTISRLSGSLDTLIWHCEQQLSNLEKAQANLVSKFKEDFRSLPHSSRALIQKSLSKIAYCHKVTDISLCGLKKIRAKTAEDESARQHVAYQWGCNRRGGCLNPGRMVALYFSSQMENYRVWKTSIDSLINNLKAETTEWASLANVAIMRSNQTVHHGKAHNSTKRMLSYSELCKNGEILQDAVAFGYVKPTPASACGFTTAGKIAKSLAALKAKLKTPCVSSNSESAEAANDLNTAIQTLAIPDIEDALEDHDSAESDFSEIVSDSQPIRELHENASDTASEEEEILEEGCVANSDNLRTVVTERDTSKDKGPAFEPRAPAKNRTEQNETAISTNSSGSVIPSSARPPTSEPIPKGLGSRRLKDSGRDSSGSTARYLTRDDEFRLYPSSRSRQHFRRAEPPSVVSKRSHDSDVRRRWTSFSQTGRGAAFRRDRYVPSEKNTATPREPPLPQVSREPSPIPQEPPVNPYYPFEPSASFLDHEGIVLHVEHQGLPGQLFRREIDDSFLADEIMRLSQKWAYPKKILKANPLVFLENDYYWVKYENVLEFAASCELEALVKPLVDFRAPISASSMHPKSPAAENAHSSGGLSTDATNASSSSKSITTTSQLQLTSTISSAPIEKPSTPLNTDSITSATSLKPNTEAQVISAVAHVSAIASLPKISLLGERQLDCKSDAKASQSPNKHNRTETHLPTADVISKTPFRVSMTSNTSETNGSEETEKLLLNSQRTTIQGLPENSGSAEAGSVAIDDETIIEQTELFISQQPTHASDVAVVEMKSEISQYPQTLDPTSFNTLPPTNSQARAEGHDESKHLEKPLILPKQEHTSIGNTENPLSPLSVPLLKIEKSEDADEKPFVKMKDEKPFTKQEDNKDEAYLKDEKPSVKQEDKKTDQHSLDDALMTNEFETAISAVLRDIDSSESVENNSFTSGSLSQPDMNTPVSTETPIVGESVELAAGPTVMELPTVATVDCSDGVESDERSGEETFEGPLGRHAASDQLFGEPNDNIPEEPLNLLTEGSPLIGSNDSMDCDAFPSDLSDKPPSSTLADGAIYISDREELPSDQPPKRSFVILDDDDDDPEVIIVDDGPIIVSESEECRNNLATLLFEKRKRKLKHRRESRKKAASAGPIVIE
ncbi:hypothetical protein CcCBS67573_g00454 [Chytriomyces confervae]|uniref:Uncharacterized protein n=1 Tax=Chytriomyces confervae TaxID=246404 RepID=A0A507FPT8_9FUNG|nr:hypothetical protein CcCBS67573_g00454 [Chytriomyces confervae]